MDQKHSASDSAANSGVSGLQRLRFKLRSATLSTAKVSGYNLPNRIESGNDDQFVSRLMQDPKLREFVLSQLPESEKGGFLDYVGTDLLDRFEQTGSIDDLVYAITLLEKALAITPNDSPDRPRVLDNLGNALRWRFERTGSVGDIHRAIEMNDQAVHSTPEDHPNHATYVSNLGTALQSRFERIGSMEDLHRSIETIEQVVKLTPADHPSLAIRLNNLGNVLQSRFARTGSMEDLNRAIEMNEQAVQSTPVDHPDCAVYHSNLGIAMQRRFERMGLIEDLDRAIEVNEHAVKSTPVDHPNLSKRLINLGTALQSRFVRMGSMEDLDRAIEITKRAVNSTPVNHPNHAMYLNNLGIALKRRFERIGSIADLDCAIDTSEQAVQLTPVDHPNRVVRLSGLANALQRRFERMGSIKDADRTIEINEQAVRSIPVNHPDRGGHLNNLGNALQSRFNRTGLMEDLDRAIETKEQAVKSTPVDHPNRAIRLSNLGTALQSRFVRTGSIQDLDHAIETKEQAVNSTPLDHPKRAMYLTNLGNALRRRFERMASMEDLNHAIEANEQAIQSTPVDHPNRAMYLSNLGTALGHRFERTGSMEDLEHALEICEQAVTSTPMNHPSRGRRLNNLATALRRRFERTGSTEDLHHAIEIKERVLNSTPENHPDYAMFLNNLGNALQSRFQRTRSMKDLDRAIETSEQAVKLTPVDHSNRATRLNTLGNALQSRFEMLGSMEDLHRAIETNEQGANSHSAAPSHRLSAAQACADLLISQGMLTRAKPILEAAVNLLPRIAPRHLKQTDAQFNISQFANLTTRAVSLSLANMDDPYKALQLLELGRGILANLQLEVRSDISVLAVDHPALAHQFQELRNEIDSPSRISAWAIIEDQSVDVNPTSSTFIPTRRTLLNQFDDLMAEIRSLPGYANFLQSPAKSELHSLAEGGPIVAFNLSNIRSDAFLITTNEIRFVHLPLLTSDSAEEMTRRFLVAINNQGLQFYHRSMCEVNAVLEWLWDAAVSPILDELGFTVMPRSGPWPRVWWVRSGLLNMLPIHAAGYHSSTPPQTALDRVISSYVPTVKSLAYARARVPRPHQLIVKDKAILIAMPKTPEQKNLRFVETEIKYLEDLFSCAPIDVKVKRKPTRMEALSELPEAGIVHFACHGFSAEDPSQSSFHLQDWQTSPLTVSDLMSLNIKSAKFAYLSACHTSSMRDVRLLDESISLSSAIQLSGYPSVVATLWQVEDFHSAQVAKDVYKWILEDVGINAERAAEGLHKAVRGLRDGTRRVKKRHDPLVWAPYIHVGI